MIIKLAIDPLTLMAGGYAAAKTIGHIGVSNQLHDIGHFLSAKSNKVGKAIQKMSLADSIIAAKKGSEGKVWANRRLLPSLFWGEEQGKTLASVGMNTAAGSIPKLKHLFVGNKLKVNRLKNVLRTAHVVDRGALAGQVAAPSYLGYRGFKNEYDRTGDVKQATKQGLVGAATGGLISAGLEIPRRIAGSASALHKHLSHEAGYGYKLLEEASHSAEKSMNRPGLLNYSKHFYATPEENFKAPTGRLVGDNFKRLMGQDTIKRFDKVKGNVYHSDDVKKKGILTNILDKADEIKNRMVKKVTK